MHLKKIPIVETTTHLTLFFAGWGMDEHPFADYHPRGGDLIICYDYKTLDFDWKVLTPYSSITVVAWSMGVWAAFRLLAGKQLPIVKSIAINGTPNPVDDLMGIPVAIFRGTLEGLNEKSLWKFRKRMCGTTDVLNRFLEQAPQRSLDDLHEELDSIGRQATNQSACNYRWDEVYIGRNDKIFPAANQERAWAGHKIVRLDCEHYSEYIKELIVTSK